MCACITASFGICPCFSDAISCSFSKRIRLCQKLFLHNLLTPSHHPHFQLPPGTERRAHAPKVLRHLGAGHFDKRQFEEVISSRTVSSRTHFETRHFAATTTHRTSTGTWEVRTPDVSKRHCNVPTAEQLQTDCFKVQYSIV